MFGTRAARSVSTEPLRSVQAEKIVEYLMALGPSVSFFGVTGPEFGKKWKLSSRWDETKPWAYARRACLAPGRVTTSRPGQGKGQHGRLEMGTRRLVGTGRLEVATRRREVATRRLEVERFERI